MSAGKTRRDLLYSFGAQFSYKVLGFVVLVLLARALTSADFGRVMFALSLATTFGLLTEFGSGSYLMRGVSARPSEGLRYTGRILGSRLPLVAAYLVCLNGAVAWIAPDLLPVVAATSIYAASKEIHGTYAALFLGLKRVVDTITSYGSSMLVLAGVIAVAWALGIGLSGVLAGYVAAGLVLVAASVLLARRIGPLNYRHRRGTTRLVIAASLPLFLLTLLEFVQWRIDPLMLGWLVSYESVAVYEGGGKLVEASQFLARPLTMIFFPICAGLAAEGRYHRLRSVALRLLIVAAWTGAAITLALVLLGDIVVPLFFGESFRSSVPVLVALAPLVPLLFATAILTFLATSLHLERQASVGAAGAVVMHVVLAALWIPAAGAIGAAHAFLASQAAVVAWLLLICGRRLR